MYVCILYRFEKHWFPEVPAKGQGYRCIRVNGLSPVDMTLQKAAVQCGLRYRDLRLPTELTVWVDPNEVCYRSVKIIPLNSSMRTVFRIIIITHTHTHRQSPPN